MKIVRLVMKNIKGVRQLDIRANPRCNEISGPNGAGKSSVLDAIMWAFGGRRTIDAKPLRDGEEKGEIVAETEDLEVKRRFSENGDTRLTITAKDGRKLGQKELDELWGQFSFDPLAFSRMSPAEQLTTMQALAGPEFCTALAELDNSIAEAMEERTLAGRELNRIGAIPEVAKVDPVDIGETMAELERAQKENREQDKRETVRNNKRAEGRANDEMIASLERQVEDLQTKIAQRRALAQAIEAQLADLPEPNPQIDTTPLQKRIADAGDQNRRAQEYQEYLRRVEAKTAAAKRYNEADERVKALREKREELRRSAKLPVDGVTFGESGIRVKGIPFEQLSSSERIRISTRIGMGMNYKLRVLRIQDGSLLDASSFAEVNRLAEEFDYQLWIETVGAGHGDAIVLEQGEVVQAPMSAVGAF